MNKLPLRFSCLLPFGTLSATPGSAAATSALGSGYHAKNTPEVVLADPSVGISFGDEKLVIEDGLQPSMVITRTGTILVQSQTSRKSFPAERYASWALHSRPLRGDNCKIQIAL